jgi:hypothetical protein
MLVEKTTHRDGGFFLSWLLFNLWLVSGLSGSSSWGTSSRGRGGTSRSTSNSEERVQVSALDGLEEESRPVWLNLEASTGNALLDVFLGEFLSVVVEKKGGENAGHLFLGGFRELVECLSHYFCNFIISKIQLLITIFLSILFG